MPVFIAFEASPLPSPLFSSGDKGFRRRMLVPSPVRRTGDWEWGRMPCPYSLVLPTFPTYPHHFFIGLAEILFFVYRRIAARMQYTRTAVENPGSLPGLIVQCESSRTK